MHNQPLTVSMITREAIRLWRNSNAFLENISPQRLDDFSRPVTAKPDIFSFLAWAVGDARLA